MRKAYLTGGSSDVHVWSHGAYNKARRTNVMQHTHLTGDSSNDDVGSDGSHSKAGDEFLSDYDLQLAAGNPHLRAHTHTHLRARAQSHTQEV